MNRITKNTEREEKKIHHITNVEELITITNDQLEDTLYIADEVFVPEKNNIRRLYRTDFSLKSKNEAKELVKTKKAIFYTKDKEYDFLVYNEKTGELISFKKNDYLIYDHGYFTFDGTHYISYDNNGKEIGRFSFINKKMEK